MTIKKSISRRKLLCTTALFATSTVSGTLPSLAATEEEVAVDTFYSSGKYTSCDIKYLSDLWNEPWWETKVSAGQKIMSGNENILREDLGVARQNGINKGIRCEYSEGGYSYNDAEKLARYWGTDSVWDAKLKIGAALERGENLSVLSALQRAR